MHDLTWKEFKEAVEKAGVTDDAEVSYIDVRGNYMPDVYRGVLRGTGRPYFRVRNGPLRYDFCEEDDDVPT